MGVLNYSLGNFEKSKRCFEKAILNDHDYTDAIYGLGNVYIKQKEIFLAITAFLKCLNIDILMDKAKKKLEDCYLALSENRFIDRNSNDYIHRVPKSDLLSIRNIQSLKDNIKHRVSRRNNRTTIKYSVHNGDKCIFCNGIMEGPTVKDLLRCNKCGIHRKQHFPLKEVVREQLKGFMLSACFDKVREASRLRDAKYQISILEKYIEPGKLFDVGAAAGFFMKVANDHNWMVDGNEISTNAILWCKEKYVLDIRYGFLEEIDLPKNYYDAVVLWHSLEHVFNPQTTLGICKELLRSDGLLLIAVPNKHGADLIKYYEELHFYEFSLDGLHWWLQSYGFEPLEIIVIDHEEIPQMNLLYRKISTIL